MLKEYDDDFSKLFRVCAMFDYEMDNNGTNLSAMSASLKDYAVKKDYKPVEEAAVCALLEHSVRLSERQDKLSTRFSVLTDTLTEANQWAVMDNADSITSEHITRAIKKREERFNLYASKYSSMLENNEIFIDTEGFKVGQINGLCVMQTDDFCFGMPTRITASTYTGKAGVVNIEKEAEMSGPTHDKGVHILTGYLGSKYAQSFPLTLSCRICFEQSYSGVDGDSASSTETYAIISSLSGVPLNQSIAVTGSVNQRGEIQPIGGATYKIEGFFRLCKHRGLTGKQGVMIPSSNVKDLVLCDEVVEAVKAGSFHIYAIDTIDDGLELLTGKKAGRELANGGYSKGSVHALAYAKLKSYFKKSCEQ
jgi:predicted ATP-dependent protease